MRRAEGSASSARPTTQPTWIGQPRNEVVGNRHTTPNINPRCAAAPCPSCRLCCVGGQNRACRRNDCSLPFLTFAAEQDWRGAKSCTAAEDKRRNAGVGCCISHITTDSHRFNAPQNPALHFPREGACAVLQNIDDSDFFCTQKRCGCLGRTPRHNTENRFFCAVSPVLPLLLSCADPNRSLHPALRSAFSRVSERQQPWVAGNL